MAAREAKENAKRAEEEEVRDNHFIHPNLSLSCINGFLVSI
jgi:hypothetical protein